MSATPTTPHKQITRLVSGDTPPSAKGTSSGRYQGANLPEGRQVVMRDLGDWVPEVSFEDMKKHFLPQLNSDLDLDATKKHLIKVKIVLENIGWKAFSDKLPAEDKEREEKAFASLKDIFDQVIKCVKSVSGKKLEPILSYVHAGHSAPLSDRTNSSLPDGYGLLSLLNLISSAYARSIQSSNQNNRKKKEPKHEYLDIPFAAEYKKKTGDANLIDDIEKIIWSMQHIMRNDPRRRFTFGITIENTTTRIWFCCRQAVVVSKEFDFMKDWENLLYFILSMCFATTTDLGWDPTVTLKLTEKKWQYDFKVGVKTYRTTEALSTFAADALRGRATRVYRANQLLPEDALGPDVAIKDSWCDEDRTSERKILGDVLKDVTEEEKKYFLTIIEEDEVKVGELLDDTEKLIMRGFCLSGDNQSTFSRFKIRKPEGLIPAAEKETGTSNTSNSATGLAPNYIQAPTVTLNTYQFHRKVHRRTVFEEVGKPIHQLTSMKEIFTALSHVVQALEIMYKKRYVHRDVSIGNILIVNGQGKLSDLEYAKVMGRETNHNVRTGTIDFISIEAEVREYIYVPIMRAPSLAEKKALRGNTQRKPLPEPPAFIHNPLHDLESVWWVAIWCMFWNTPTKGGSTDDDLSLQRRQAEMIFPQTLESLKRNMFLQNDRTFQNGVKGMYFEDWCSEILNPFRLFLLENFAEAEKSLNGGQINLSVFPSLHETAKGWLEESNFLPNLELEPLVRSIDRRKRKASISLQETEASSSKKAKVSQT